MAVLPVDARFVSNGLVEVREIIPAAHAELRYLPPYSPDLNPVEQPFAKLKATCARPRNAPFLPSTIASAWLSISLLKLIVVTSSKTPVTLKLERIPL